MAGAKGTTERGSLFVTTRWSVVLAAQDKARPESASALDALCRAYWYPLYAFVRRQGRSPEDAEDLTQSFLAKLLEKDYLRAAAPEKGRLRTFLLVALKRFLANEWDRARRLKRGGGLAPLPLDTAVAERRYQAEPPADLLPADRVFERRWAMTLLEETLDRLRAEYASAGKETEFESLKECLTAARGEIPYGPLATGLGLSEGATRVAVHRLRKRFRETFRAAVADTVSDPAEVDDELRYVAAVLSRA
ncbi:MAG: sigma-70 family RNA polymerase sigma factor [Verrucomicrobiae bacterium]|nr:sigma-70 family RNA polymerase sigma factor [Verrucomicrobiae bacterium]